MNRAFCTYVSDEYYHSMGADKLVKSAKFFHPEIPMIVYGSKDIEEFGVPFGLMHPIAIKKTLLRFPDGVFYLDADSIITGPLTELLNSVTAFGLVGVRNNNDYNLAGMDSPIGQEGAGTEHYWNAGLVATNNMKFVDEWIEANKLYGRMLPFMEQSVLNAIKNKYTHCMVDSIHDDVYYGVSALSGKDTHWDSWKFIQVEGEKLMLNNKQIKVLHHAGGFKPDKLGFYMFNEDTRKRLITITT